MRGAPSCAKVKVNESSAVCNRCSYPNTKRLLVCEGPNCNMPTTSPVKSGKKARLVQPERTPPRDGAAHGGPHAAEYYAADQADKAKRVKVSLARSFNTYPVGRNIPLLYSRLLGTGREKNAVFLFYETVGKAPG